MEFKKAAQLSESLRHLQEALQAFDRRRKTDVLPLLALTKAFEVAVESGWRELKRRVEDEGLDVPSPKAAMRQAARLGWISDPESWMEMIEARNASVHDYFGISETDFVKLAGKFLSLVKSTKTL